MNLNFDRATRARIHTALLDAMPGEKPIAEQAFAEAVAWADTDGIADLETLLGLANEIDFHIYRAIHRSDFEFAEVDATALGDLFSAATIRLAMRLAGYRPLARVSGQKMVWTDAPGDDPTINVILKADDFGND